MFAVLFLSFLISHARSSHARSRNTGGKKNGLIIIDLQYDFADPNGLLTVFGGPDGKNDYLNITSSEYVERINNFIETEHDSFDFVVYSIDYHPPNHCSFASTLNNHNGNFNIFDAVIESDPIHENTEYLDHICLSQTGFQVLWPDHCIEENEGSQFMSSLIDIRPTNDLQRVVVWRDSELNEDYVVNYKLLGYDKIIPSFKDDIDFIQDTQNNILYSPDLSQTMYVFKGRDEFIDSYSAFKGNDGITNTGLYDALLAYNFTPDNTHLTIIGIAYDFCVIFTVRDAHNYGYEVTVMDQLTAPVFSDDVPDLIKEMEDIGISINYDNSFEDNNRRNRMRNTNYMYSRYFDGRNDHNYNA